MENNKMPGSLVGTKKELLEKYSKLPFTNINDVDFKSLKIGDIFYSPCADYTVELFSNDIDDTLNHHHTSAGLLFYYKYEVKDKNDIPDINVEGLEKIRTPSTSESIDRVINEARMLKENGIQHSLDRLIFHILD